MKNLIYILCCISFLDVQAQTKLELLGHWRDPDIPGSAAYDNAFNEAYGVVVNNREYAVIGHTLGTSFIDITDPKNLKEVARVPGKFNGPGVIHRDYDLYGCFLYAVCDEGSSSLQIIDFSDLPNSIKVVYDSDEFLTTTHNIYIDIPKARLYTALENGKNGRFALGVYDISKPEKPALLGHFNHFGDITANHVHDAYVINDTAYLNCGNNGFAIMDFSDINNPLPLFTLKPGEYYKSGYNHSGWLTPNRKTYIMADENHGSPLKVFDVSNFKKINNISILSTQDSSISIPHNPLASCDYVYVSYYYNGLQVYNIKDPKHPIQEYYYPTSTLPNELSYKGSWGNWPFFPSGNIAVADMQNGLFVVKGPEIPCNVVNSCSSTSVKPSPTIHGNRYLYPNPAKTDVYLNCDISNIGQIKIIDPLGRSQQLNYQQSDKGVIVNCHNFTGNYTIAVYLTSGEISTYKLSLNN